MKLFSKSLYEANDNVAKKAGLYHLLNRATWAQINPDQYGADIIYLENMDTIPKFLEVEVKHTWKGGRFPFETVNVLARKTKYFKTGAQLLLLAKNCQDYLILQPEHILAQEPLPINNKYCFEDEKFYQVPVKLADFYRFSRPLDQKPLNCKCGSQSFLLADSLVCAACGE